MVFIFTALFIWLKVGISADSLVLGKYKVDGLYLKLDKKLTLKADNVVIPKSKSKPTFDNIDETFDKIKHLFTFFDYIDVNNITFSDNHINVFFADEILYVTSDDYEIAGNIHREAHKLVAEVSMLYIKKDAITIKGELTYDLDRDILATKGDFDAYHIKGAFNADKVDDTITFDVNSSSFTDLRTLMEKFKLKPKVNSWVVDKVQAKNHKILFLKGAGKIVDNNFKMDFEALKGQVLFEDVTIKFKEQLAPVLADSFVLEYRDKGLFFDLKNPTYKKRNLAGSTIALTDLLGDKPTVLKLDLKIVTKLDKEAQKILKAYKLNMPIQQKGVPAKLHVQLDEYLKDKNKKATVNVAVDLGKGNLYIGKTKLPVIKGKATYDKGYVTLKDVHLKEDWYEGKVKGKIDLKGKKADLKLDVKQISIGDKEKFLVLKNKQLPLALDYSKNTRIDLPSLGLKIVNRKKDKLIQINDLKKIKPYLKNIDIKVDGGKLDIIQKSANTYTFKGELRRSACFFYEKNGACHTRVPCSGTIKNGQIDFYAFGKRLYYNSKKSRVKVSNLNIDLKKLLTTYQKASKSKPKKGKNRVKPLVIIGKNSKIRYDTHTLVTDSYDIEIKPNGNIKAFAALDGDVVKFSKKGNNFSVKALRVKDKMLHPLIEFDGLKEGRYTLKKSGNPDKVMKGQIIIEGGVMRDFKAYNNTLAFINAVPALATLSKPGFSEKGFKIVEGVAEYRMTADRIIFDSIYIKGTSATLAGKGRINLKTKKMNINLAIQTAREFGKVVGSLPLLGYILMGKDKSMTVGLRITGTLDQPVVNTSATEDILSLPLKLIKRTLESPANIINK